MDLYPTGDDDQTANPVHGGRAPGVGAQKHPFLNSAYPGSHRLYLAMSQAPGSPMVT